MIEVIDNALPEPLFKSILNIIDGGNNFHGSNTFTWYLTNDIYNPKKYPKGISTLQLSHILYYDVDDDSYSGEQLNSPHAQFIHKLIIPILEKKNINGTIVKSKFNLLFPHPKINNELKYNVPHRDLEFPHYSVLLYMNDSDGDTVFFKDIGVDELQRIKPKLNRMVISDGVYHTSTNPIKSSYRIVLNMVLRKDNE